MRNSHSAGALLAQLDMFVAKHILAGQRAPAAFTRGLHQANRRWIQAEPGSTAVAESTTPASPPSTGRAMTADLPTLPLLPRRTTSLLPSLRTCPATRAS